MKRFLSIAVILATTAAAHADGIQFTDSANPAIKPDCSAVPLTAAVTLGGVSTTLASVQHGLRQDNVPGLGDKPGYCADILVSNSTDFWDAWNAKLPTALPIRQAVSGNGTNPGMIMVISMNVVLSIPVPAAGSGATTVEGTFIQALQQNTAQSAADYSANNATTTLLNAFLSEAAAGGGTKGPFGTTIINVAIDGSTGAVYYQGPSNSAFQAAVNGAGNPSFIQDIVAMWYGDTTDGSMIPEHKAFESELLFGGSTIPDEPMQLFDVNSAAQPIGSAPGADGGPAQ